MPCYDVKTPSGDLSLGGDWVVCSQAHLMSYVQLGGGFKFF